MTSLTLPDVNVWLALASPEHIHSQEAKRWWDRETGLIALCRFTQLGLLRRVTTATVMGGKPLSLDEAWPVYDSFLTDERVTFLSEPEGIGDLFRQRAAGKHASPKLLGDAWLLAFADARGGKLLTFDRALAPRHAQCLL